MKTLEIPREAWVRRLNEFTNLHEGWLVSAEILNTESGAQPEITNLPLLGVSADRINHDGTITVSVACSATEHFTHSIKAVARVYVEPVYDGGEVALLIESTDGTRTILRFRAVALPETAHRLAHR